MVTWWVGVGKRVINWSARPNTHRNIVQCCDARLNSRVYVCKGAPCTTIPTVSMTDTEDCEPQALFNKEKRVKIIYKEVM